MTSDKSNAFSIFQQLLIAESDDERRILMAMNDRIAQTVDRKDAKDA